MSNNKEAKESFNKMLDMYNIKDFYKYSKLPLKITLTLIMPFVLFGWLFWYMMCLINYFIEINTK